MMVQFSPVYFSVTSIASPRIPPPRPLPAQMEAAEEVPTTLSKISWLREGKAVLHSAYANMAALVARPRWTPRMGFPHGFDAPPKGYSYTRAVATLGRVLHE